MDIIYTNSNYEELGYLKNYSLDMEVGKYNNASNDFELTISINDRDKMFDDNCLIYCEDSEFGGIVENKKIDTFNYTITYKGKTFRGMLEKEYIQPPLNESYLVLNDEANNCIQRLIGNRFNDLFVVDDLELSGISIKYNVRDLNLLEALEKALKSANAKLDIKHQNDGKVHLKAVLINDLSDYIQYDNNYQASMMIETKAKPYNHILALGKGELTERLRVNLYMQKDGTWGDIECYTGLNRKTYKYEDVNIEDAEELKAQAIEKVTSESGNDNLDISFSADNAELYDIVGVKEDITGYEFKTQITQKILKISNDKVDLSYKVGD